MSGLVTVSSESLLQPIARKATAIAQVRNRTLVEAGIIRRKLNVYVMIASEAQIDAKREVAERWRREVLLGAARVSVAHRRFRIDAGVGRPDFQVASRRDDRCPARANAI